MLSRTRVAIIFAAILAVLSGGLMASPVNAATFCDSSCVLQQLQSHNFVPVPSGDGVRTVAADGSMLYYTGPNGLEIRLSHDKTTQVVTKSANLAITVGSLATGGEALTANDIVMKIFPAWIPKAAKVAGVFNQQIQDFFSFDFTGAAVKAMQGDYCLGATLWRNSVQNILDRPLRTYAAMLQGNLGGVVAAMAGIRAIWFEPCSLNKGQLSDAMTASTLADIGLAPPPPAPAPAPVSAAQPIYTFSVYHTGGVGLNVRAAPSRNGAFRYKIPEGGSVSIVCQVHGDRVIPETDVWDRLIDGGYVYDEYVSTPQIGVFSITAGASNDVRTGGVEHGIITGILVPPYPSTITLPNIFQIVIVSACTWTATPGAHNLPRLARGSISATIMK